MISNIDLFKKASKERLNKLQKYKTEINEITKHLLNDFPKSSNERVVFVKGGSAWQKAKEQKQINPRIVLNCNGNEVINPAFTSYNVDIECIVKSESDFKIIHKEIKSSLNKLKNKLILSGSYSGGYKIETSDNINPSGTVKMSQGKMQLSHELGRMGSSFLLRNWETRKEETNKGEGELLLYIAIYMYGEKFPMVRFTNIYLNEYNGLHYLNTTGLLMYLNFIPKDRTEKIFNIDEERRSALMGHNGYTEDDLRKDIKQFQMLHNDNTLNIYLKPFSHHAYQSLIFFYMKYFDKSKITNTESYIVEVYRSAINYTISQINKDLASFGYDAVCFVSGGDAMRRHISSIKKSADIDAKLYYKNPKNK